MWKWLKKLFSKKSTPITIKPFKSNAPEYFEIAKGELGTKEISGSQHNPKILQYHKSTSLKASTDEVAWCASFVNWCLAQAGLKGTNSAMARSFMNWGIAIKTPFVGCVVVFWRGIKEASTGHVAFYVKEDEHYIYVLGGNQGNEVSISKYPKTQLLGYRQALT